MGKDSSQGKSSEVPADATPQTATRGFTAGPWAQMRDWPLEIVPAAEADKRRGASIFPEDDAQYAQSIASINHAHTFEGWEAFSHRRFDLGECKANARLIAAAPDLLAALKALLNDIETGLLVRDITRDGESGWSMQMLAFVRRLQTAQSAIAKAEGRS